MRENAHVLFTVTIRVNIHELQWSQHGWKFLITKNHVDRYQELGRRIVRGSPKSTKSCFAEQTTPDDRPVFGNFFPRRSLI